MNTRFELLMIGAMYENGGNVAHRFLDGHPDLFVYPFESQLGTRHVNDALSGLFPAKYRWPAFELHATAREDFWAISDEETRIRARTPQVSKFRHVALEMDDDERCAIYLSKVGRNGRSTANNVAAFLEATFEAWKNHRRSGRERIYVGYSPIVTVDAERMLLDLPAAHLLHVIRNPWSAFADTLKRPVPLSLPSYTLGWTLCQYFALIARQKFPGRVHVVRTEDIMAEGARALAPLLAALGIEQSDALGRPSWNGQPLEEVFPWGTIRHATPEANRAAARELTKEQVEEIRLRTLPYLEPFGYSELPGAWG
jgi:hypothetical protein